MMGHFFLLILYIVAGCVDCVRARQGKSRVMKPFLMPLLLAFYVAACASSGTAPQPFLVAALAASFAGDVLLMFTGRHRAFLIAGSLFFALAHVFFVPLFLSGLSVPVPFPLSVRTAAPLIALMAGAVMCRIIFTQFRGGARTFFFVYGLFLFSMCFAASLRVCVTVDAASLILYAGALIFTVSDSLLALNVSETLRGAEPARNRPVMPTYLIAQLLITLSLL